MTLFGAGSAPPSSQLTPILARKTVDQQVLNSTTFVNDTALTGPVVGSAVYEMATQVIYTAAAASKIQFGWSGPSGATLDWVVQALGVGVTAADEGIFTALARTINDTKIVGCDGTIPVAARLTGLLIVSSTPGSLTLQWAQAVAGATATIVKAGSYMVLKRVA